VVRVVYGIYFKDGTSAEDREAAWDECPAIRGKAGSEQTVQTAASREIPGLQEEGEGTTEGEAGTRVHAREHVPACGDFCNFRLKLRKSENILVVVGPHRRIDSSLFRLIRFGLIVGILVDLPSIAVMD
jgi:hypothetical protein